MSDDKNSDLNIWLARVKQAQTRKDVFRILDEFRKHEWTDVQCQTMSHLYIRLIDLMPPEEGGDLEVASVSIADDTASGAAADAAAGAASGAAVASGAAATGAEEGGEPKKAVINEGPVWYEKM
ncbi:MAG: hypothetical protein C0507_00710 [Cyanobacteria bacterium PR.3.49]|nr:hypothetical protein [Cyanobacteria bacterium PR.3.49]